MSIGRVAFFWTLGLALASDGAPLPQQDVELAAPSFYAPEDELRGYVVEALEQNPAIPEAFARYRAALERVPQTRTLPDPTFSFVQAIRSVETRVGPQLNSVTFSQRFPWFGKLARRERVAIQEALAVYHMARARQRDVIVRTKRAYYDLAHADAAAAITHEERSLLEHYAALAEARYANGQGLQQSVLKLQAEITRVSNRLELVDRQRASAAVRLNALMNRAPDTPVPVVAPPLLPDVVPDVEELHALGLENRHELKATKERIAKSERAIEAAERDGWPDFVLGVGFVNVGRRSDPAGLATPPPDNGKNAVSISAGITVPLWRDKYDGALRAASETLLAERSRYASVQNEMEFSIHDELVRLESVREQIRLFERALIPQSEAVLRATEAAYETGELGVLDLLDSERVLLNTRLATTRYRTDVLIALANIEHAIGTEFPRSEPEPPEHEPPKE